MNSNQTKYQLLKKESNFLTDERSLSTTTQVIILIILCILSSLAVFFTWTNIYNTYVNIPPKLTDVPANWHHRTITYAKIVYNGNSLKNTFRQHQQQQQQSPPPPPQQQQSENSTNNNSNFNNTRPLVKHYDNEKIYPSKYGNFIYEENTTETNQPKLICYYGVYDNSTVDKTVHLNITNIEPNLCTHINIGLAEVQNNQIYFSNELKLTLLKLPELKKKYTKPLKLLLWIGGGTQGFQQMVLNHANRKLFIQSIKETLEMYKLDGVDLDWEFPSAYRRERQHFTQLLHEIRREYQREHRTYLLSVAVAAPEGIAFFSYDISELNRYVDYVNIMTYDYHFYTKSTPFTGLNAPLYKRHNENYYLSTININSSINYWHSQGLDKKKIIMGLPTYGHSFKLVNPYNAEIMSPALGYGDVGDEGFVSYSEVCWFQMNNYFVKTIFDTETCSPYTHVATEWISYENEQSIECKTNYVKNNDYGGVMVFSLNTDDHIGYCQTENNIKYNYNNNDIANNKINSKNKFPLLKKIYSILLNN